MNPPAETEHPVGSDRILPQLWKLRLPLLAFALSFQLLENFLFTPAMGLLGRVLIGRPVVDSTGFVQFFLSPMGFLALFRARGKSQQRGNQNTQVGPKCAC